MKNLLIASLAMSLAGCSTMAAYEPPSGSNTAQVKVRSDSASWLYVYDDVNCHQNAKQALSLHASWPVRSTPKDPKEDVQEIVFSSDKRIYAMLIGTRGTAECGTVIDFQFKKGARYDAFYEWNGAACVTHLTEIADGGDTAANARSVKDFSSRQGISKGCLNTFLKGGDPNLIYLTPAADPDKISPYDK